MRQYIISNSIKIKSIIMLSLMVLTFATIAQAQQKIDPTVEVEKEFDGKMTNIVKSPLNISIPDSLTSFNLSFNYSIFNKPYKDLYEFTPLPSAKLQSSVEERLPSFLARVGAGFPLNPFAGLIFQPNLGKRSFLVANISYDGYFGKNSIAGVNSENMVERVPDAKIAASNALFKSGLQYSYHWKSGFLTAGINYKNNFNTYYGLDENHYKYLIQNNTSIERSFMKDSSSHRYNQFGGYFKVGSTDGDKSTSKISYLLDFEYKNTSDKICDNLVKGSDPTLNRLKENYIKASGVIAPVNGRFNRFSIALNSENVNYSGIQEYKYGIYEIMPQYGLKKGRFAFDAGVKLSGRYKSKDDIDKYHRYFFIKAAIAFEAIRDNLWLYANVDGENRINSYSGLLELNSWISPYTFLRAGSTPFIFNGGFKGKALGKLGYDLHVTYALHKGMLQFVNMPYSLTEPHTGMIETAYSNHNQFSICGSINWKSRDFEGGTTLLYSNYTDGKESTLASGNKPLGYAPFKWSVYGVYNYRERLYIGLDGEFVSSAPMGVKYQFQSVNQGSSDSFIYQIVDAKSYFNLGLNARYVINPNFAIFINGENLLNAQIQHIPQYLEKGISFTAGLLVKL